MSSVSWLTRDFFAMGCEMVLRLDLPDGALAQAILARGEQMFHAAEARLSRFRPKSELSQLNAQPAQWIPVSTQLWAVLAESLHFAAETDGLFDPTLLKNLVAAGYDQSFEQLRMQTTQPANWSSGRWRDVKVDPERQAVCLPYDVMLDFGGIAKGLIAQQVVQFLQQWGPCLVDAGGDLVAGDPPQGQLGWATGITAPLENGVAIRPNLARLWLHNGALMTSGVDYRHWPTTMGEQHHIIDPRVGVSAETDLLTVTVLAADACQAEAWATATLVAGFEHGYAQLQTHNIAAMLVTRAKEIHITPTFEPYLQLETSLVR